MFLNHSHQFADKIEWNHPELEKLWLYNLHYFDYLLPLNKETDERNFLTAQVIIEDWMENNYPGRGTGWEPYPMSLRIINWIFFYDKYFDPFGQSSRFRQKFLESLFQQAKYLSHFIEFHLQANHLFTNLKALFFAGIFFREERWMPRITKLLKQQIDEQILPDGGHFERSPMYHAIILTDILDIINLLRHATDLPFNISQSITALNLSDLEETARKMLLWLQNMLHPDGEIALFGDSAFKVSPDYRQIEKYFIDIIENQPDVLENPGCTALDDSGYFAFQSSEQKLIIDGGKLGVDYQPGHAHCDLLSYEYSFNRKRFIVDSGVGNYLPTDLRQKARSIYSHNTVVVNGLDQAQIWKAFRMGKRVVPDYAGFKTVDDNFRFEGQYQNSLSKKYAYRHRRAVRFIENKFFVVEDWIYANQIRSIENLVHVHPDRRIQQSADSINLIHPDDEILILFNPDILVPEIRLWFYTPEFGVVQENRVIVFKPTIEKLQPMYYVYYVLTARAYALIAGEFLRQLEGDSSRMARNE